MSQLYVDLKCGKCNTDKLVEEFFIDGFYQHCRNCGYYHEEFLNEEELNESNQ